MVEMKSVKRVIRKSSIATIATAIAIVFVFAFATALEVVYAGYGIGGVLVGMLVGIFITFSVFEYFIGYD